MRRSHLFWPMILIAIGILWLLNNLGIIDVDNIWSIVVPVVLIALGISILFGSVIGTRATETRSLSIPLEGAEKARLRFSYGAGRMTLRSGARAGELLSGMFGDGVEHKIRHKDAVLDVQLSMPTLISFPFNWSSGDRQWSVDLSNSIALDLALEIGAAEAQLDLTGLRVTDLNLHTGASSTDLRLPAGAGHTRVNIEAGAASIDIHVPQGVAARISSDSAISDIKINSERFPRREGIYESPDYANAANKADIKVSVGIGSVSIR
ncbi:MAG: hypothetical protein JXB07_00455 [Anaerolineae bacterium]|nr:hypothetical protein [Anaerolineae bacterium]